MADDGRDDPLELTFDERAARAWLACFSAGPRFGPTGAWIVVIEDASGRPLQLHHLELVERVEDPPVAAVAEALQRCGYESVMKPPLRLWAAEWQLVTPQDRAPRRAPA